MNSPRSRFLFYSVKLSPSTSLYPTPNEYRDIMHAIRYARRRLLRCKLLESIFQSCQPRRRYPLNIEILGRLLFDRSGTTVIHSWPFTLASLIACDVINDNYPRRRHVRVRALHRRRRRGVLTVIIVIDIKTRTCVHHVVLARSSTRSLSVSIVIVVALADDDLIISTVSHGTWMYTPLVETARVSRSTRHTWNRRVARPVRTRARRRVTLVKFQPGIYRLKRRHTATRTPGSVGQRRRERENGEKQWGERGRERGSPVSPPSSFLLPGERLWRRPGSHCCFPRCGVTCGGWLGEGREDAIISQHPLARRTNPHGTGAWRRWRVHVSWWEIAIERERTRGTGRMIDEEREQRGLKEEDTARRAILKRDARSGWDEKEKDDDRKEKQRQIHDSWSEATDREGGRSRVNRVRGKTKKCVDKGRIKMVRERSVLMR